MGSPPSVCLCQLPLITNWIGLVSTLLTLPLLSFLAPRFLNHNQLDLCLQIAIKFWLLSCTPNLVSPSGVASKFFCAGIFLNVWQICDTKSFRGCFRVFLCRLSKPNFPPSTPFGLFYSILGSLSFNLLTVFLQ